MKKDKNTQLRGHTPPSIINFFVWIYHRIRGVQIHTTTIIYLKAKLLRYVNKINLKENVIIKSNAQICACNKDSKITIGKNSTIGYYTFIYSSENIEIGDDCMIAPFVYIVDSDHGIDINSKMNTQDNETSSIKIGDDVWIGSNSVILPGVEIGNGSIIAAGSVVNKDVEEFSIYGGVPAKFLKKRK